MPHPDSSRSITLRPLGPFSLAAASRFGRGFVPSPTPGDDGQMILAFPCEDAGWRTVGVRLTPADGLVVGEVTGAGAGGATDARLAAAAAEQCRRILSLDVDGAGFAEVGDRDEVVRGLQRQFPGLRPVLFHSPYEAAAWAIVGQRIRMTQAAAVKARLADQLGERVTVHGRSFAAFPSPERLARLDRFAGLTSLKVERLRALAHAALDGRLSPGALGGGDREASLGHLRTLAGIGPFSAELILVRGAGEPDHFPEHERRLQEAMRRAYALHDDAGLDELREISDAWRPFRSWVSVLLRTWLERQPA